MIDKFGISQSVLRMEDDPLCAAAGRYTSDHMPTEHAARGVVLRSPHANAEFRISDVTQGAGIAGRSFDPDRRGYGATSAKCR